MKKSLTLALALGALTVLSSLCLAQPETSRPQQESGEAQQRSTDNLDALPQITSTRIAATQIASLQEDPAFNAALEFLDEEGQVAHLKRGQILSSRSQPGVTDFSFDVTMRGSDQPGEYAKLVYSAQDDQHALVYFDDNRIIGRTPVVPQPSEAARLAACFFTPWERWQALGISCQNNFWCFFKRQQALYLTETRQRRCPNGSVQTQTRTVKIHCGC